MTISVTVRVEQKHNLGNYEHLIVAAEFGMAAETPEHGLRLVRELRQRLMAETARTVPAEAPAPAPVPAPAPERPFVDESGDPLVEEPAAAASPVDDPLADEPEEPKAPKRGRKPKAETKDPQAVREDIIRWASADVANSGLLAKTLAACGYKRLREVPDDEIVHLANALGRGS